MFGPSPSTQAFNEQQVTHTPRGSGSPSLSTKGSTANRSLCVLWVSNSQPQVNTPASIPGHRDCRGLAGLGEEVVWIDHGFMERACYWCWRSHRALRDPPTLPSCLQGLADESLLLLAQPSGVIHRFLIKCFSSSCLQTSALNNTPKKLIPFCFTWPEDLRDLGSSGGRKAEGRI